MLADVAQAWHDNQGMRFGQLVASAANIQRGELRVNPASLNDAELSEGIRALIHSDWEILLDKEIAAREKARKKAEKTTKDKE